ncbi:MAG: TolC family protein [Saprospiraceae bacterium]|nr:TolC family protein [Saprospiraceae bacterium]
MRIKNRIKVLLCIFILFNSIENNYAQIQLSLQSAIDSALQNNLNIQVARNNIAIANLNNTYANAGGMPQVNAVLNNTNSLTNIHQNLSNGVEISKNNALTNNIATGVNGSILLYNGDRVKFTKKRLELLTEQSEHELNIQIQNTIANVMIKYYDIIKQSAFIDLLKKNFEFSKNKSNLISQRAIVGMANEVDRITALMDINNSTLAIANQEMLLRQSELDLIQYIGISPRQKIIVNDSILIDNSLVEKIIEERLYKNVDFVYSENIIRLNEILLKETKALKYPSIRMNAAYNLNYTKSSSGFNLLNESYGPSLGATIQIPIYSGLVKSQEKVLNYQIKNAELAKEDKYKMMQNEVAKMYSQYQSLQSQSKQLTNNYQLALQLVELTLQKYQYNQATLLELQSAQSSFENLGYQRIQVNYLHKLAEIELKRIAYLLKE